MYWITTSNIWKSIPRSQIIWKNNPVKNWHAQTILIIIISLHFETLLSNNNNNNSMMYWINNNLFWWQCHLLVTVSPCQTLQIVNTNLKMKVMSASQTIFIPFPAWGFHLAQLHPKSWMGHPSCSTSQFNRHALDNHRYEFNIIYPKHN